MSHLPPCLELIDQQLHLTLKRDTLFMIRLTFRISIKRCLFRNVITCLQVVF